MHLIIEKKIVISFYIIIGFFCAILFFLGLTYLYCLSSKFDSKKYDSKLIELGKESIVSRDVPVSSLIIYNEAIIGEGKNDVLKNNNPIGHAEINAIKDSFKKIGVEKFNCLDRKKLILLTTYEPCPMCKSIIQEYNIKKVIFCYPKSLREKLNYLKKDYEYYINLNQSKNKRIQYELFKMHPAFDSVNIPYH